MLCARTFLCNEMIIQLRSMHSIHNLGKNWREQSNNPSNPEDYTLKSMNIFQKAEKEFQQELKGSLRSKVCWPCFTNCAVKNSIGKKVQWLFLPKQKSLVVITYLTQYRERIKRWFCLDSLSYIFYFSSFFFWLETSIKSW